jgi:DNA modification methylase
MPTQYPFPELQASLELDARDWHGSFNGRESTLHQLSPYVGKLKSGMARALINLYSQRSDAVLDPFSGSGVVPLEAALAGRYALGNDLSPYAYTLTRGKLEAPYIEADAVERAEHLLAAVEANAPFVDIEPVPVWIQEFYHPATLREVVAAFLALRKSKDFFLTSCLLGIMHHQRPGFLSYPASHLVPYLRKSMFPPEQFPEMYTYRDLRSRLLAKIKRAYRRSMFTDMWEQRRYNVSQTNAMSLPIDSESVDAIISSPPYFGALDYARDNRLRLWFLGCDDWKKLDSELTASSKVYLTQMGECLREMSRVLKIDKYCVLVLGDVERNGETRRTAEVLGELAIEVTGGRFKVETIYDDHIPDERRSRRRTRTTKFERILVMRKVL